MKNIITIIALLFTLRHNASAFIDQPDTVYGHIDPSVEIGYRGLDTILALPDPEIPPYGVYCWHWSYNWYYGVVNDMGFSHFRFGTERGQDLDGAESFTPDDLTMRRLAQSGKAAHFTLWIDSRDNYDDDETFLADYVQYVDDMITRYGPGGTFFDDNPDVPHNPMLYYELWNEPNLYYLARFEDSSMSREEFRAWIRHLYAKMLVEVYAHVRSKPEWDDVRIVGFCTDGGNQNDVGWGGSGGWIETVHADDYTKNGYTAATAYDVLSTHPYSAGYALDMERYYDYYSQWTLAGSINEIRRVMRQYRGSEAPIWFSEGGSIRSQVGERVQAAYTVRDYLFCLRHDIRRYTVMFLKDSDGVSSGFIKGSSGGTVEYYERAYALRTLADIMPNPRIIAAPSDGTDGYYHMRYKADAGNASSDTVDIVWYTAGPVTRDVSLARGEYHMIDMFGDTLDLDVTGSSVALGIGPCPIYLVKSGNAPVDGTPPAVASVGTWGTWDRVNVRFSEALDRSTAENASNYTLNGGASVSAASLGGDGRTVTLALNPVFSTEGDYILTIGGVEDAAGNAVPAGTQAAFEFRQPGNGLTGSYYSDGKNCTALVLSRIDAQVDFDWGDGSPASGVASDGFGVIWSGYVRAPQSGTYSFTTYSSEGALLTVGRYTVISALWDMPNGGTRTRTCYLEAGEMTPIELKYYENTGNAFATLSWTRPDGTDEVVPQAALYPDDSYRSTGIDDIMGRITAAALRAGKGLVVRAGSVALRELAQETVVLDAEGKRVPVNAVAAGVHYAIDTGGTVRKLVVIP